MTADLTPYQQLRAERDAIRAGLAPKVSSRTVYPPDIAKDRRAEKVRRSMETRRRACQMLIERHPQEYEAIAFTERAGVDRERGPLPGDPDFQVQS